MAPLREMSIQWFLLFSCLLVLLPVQAEIFQRNAGDSLENLGFARAYSTQMKINGTKASVEVWNSENGFFKTMALVQDHCRAKGWPETFTAGETLGFGIAIDGDLLHRWLVTMVAGDDRSTIVYQTTVSLDAYQRGQDERGRPVSHRLDAIPAYSTSQAVSHYHDGGTDTQVEVSKCVEPGVLLHSWFTRKMTSDGWKRPLGSGIGTLIFVRGKERAVITLRDAKQGGTLITRVYKTSK